MPNAAPPPDANAKPLVLITGAAGNLGRSVGAALMDAYRVVGIDRDGGEADFPVIAADVTSDESLERALAEVRARAGSRIASVIHLVAYFDFSGKDSPLYEAVNVEGTRRLLRALRKQFTVEQLVYASTMLVHEAARPGERIDETAPLAPRWAYPQSKARAEQAIRAEHGDIPYVILRLAGVYDESSTVPTMAQQMARIYERDFESYWYSGSTLVGQSMLHRDDLLAAIRRAVERRHTLPPAAEILIGEPEAVGYDALQDEIGYLVHGVENWPTLRMPKSLAAVGTRALAALEPVIPDAFDQGQRPFIKPFMIALADDHYALDVARARELLGWEPQHRLKDELPEMVRTLLRDPADWYGRHQIKPPAWMQEAQKLGQRSGDLAQRHEALVKRELAANRWAHFSNMALGTWLVVQPPLIGVREPLLAASEVGLGAAVMVFAALSLSWRLQALRWIGAGLGALVMAAPFLFATANAAAYLSDTLVGGLIFGFAATTKPDVGPSPLARLVGPDIPPGWSYNPAAWTQRLPIVVLAIVGLYVSRYLAGYQLNHLPSVWEPFFAGSPADPRNGTEEIITSYVSEAWPVSDAAVGGYTYMLEILTGLVGSTARWRTMPWLVVLFGLMIAPLGVVSIFFIVIQPILLGTWSTLALIGAAAVLVQIPYSLDELVATLQFMRRRVRAGANWLRVFLFGDTDQMPERHTASCKSRASELDQSFGVLAREAVSGGVNLPWNLVLAALVALSLLFTRLTIDAAGSLANAHHLLGALALTVISIAAAEVARAMRYFLIPLGLALGVAPFLYGADAAQTGVSVACGAALIALSFRRGPIRGRYGTWDRLVI